MKSVDFDKGMIKLVVGLGSILMVKLLTHLYDYGRYSAIHDIYHNLNGFVVIPGYTDEKGNIIEQDEK